ncbi:metallophosphoesterase [Planococcus sp. ISL-110]|uniref:metallophosphoesterase n=1 Tax=Planococcus sp. ISL-110 TaxID=2819167 RepID=UPI001BE9DA54|nr:metallophosphoesterase [Planococcus sp. ISL-110]MBT2572041.1 metallophosphoesterase [Planococcus sp. ISL-110]
MKIAILSDIHEGLNRKKSGADILGLLKDWLAQQAPDVFIISGDMTAGPEKSLALLNQLKNELPKIKILFVHGNHDLYHDDASSAYDKLLEFPGNLGNGPVDLGKDWVVIGDGGWYDYTFGVDGFTEEQFSAGQFNDFTWPDKIHAHWQEEDIAVTRHYLAKVERWLVEHQDKNIILVSHFVPFAHFVQVKNEPSWDFFNAMMGSAGIGGLAEKYDVKKLVFGHIHTRYHEQYKGIDCICNPLGYFPHEWTSDSAQAEISSTIKVIEI